MRSVILILFLCSVHLGGVSQSCVVDTYTSQIGVREATGHNDGKQVEVYLKSVKLGKGFPWCAAFVRWCFDQCGIKTTINAMALSTHRPGHIIYFKGNRIRTPQAGDVGTLYYAKLGRIGHTFFFDREINTKIFKSVEGNTNGVGSREGDGVYIKYRSYKATYSISRWTE